jgi:hypothetical protein
VSAASGKPPPVDTAWLHMQDARARPAGFPARIPPGPIRRALHRRRRDRAFAREMRARRDETLAAMAEVGVLRETVEQRLQRALAAVGERDAWIHADPQRARDWEKWRVEQMRAAADRARGEH